MKKHLIAAAVAAAVVAPAFAQSSVSVYGRLDGGYRDLETKINGAKQNDASAASTSNLTKSGIDYSGFTTSRIGVMGSEDLGGGLKAGFVVEGNIAAAGGTSSSNNATAFNFGRQQYLTLSGNFGTVLIGKTDAMVKTVFDSFDAGFSNNFSGAFDSFTDGNGTKEAGGVGIVGNRRDATARYSAPVMSGFRASVGVMRSTTEKDTDASKVEDNNGYELGLSYSAGPLAASAAYRDTTSKNAGGTSNLDVKTAALGASYNLGPAILFGQYFDQEDKQNATGAKIDTTAYAIGIRVPVGASTLFASYTDGEYKPAGTKTDQKGYQLGVKYDLSKRTYAYAVYGDKEEKAGANKLEAKDFGIGIAHHF